MDETMVKNWNDLVKPQDLVWHLGDVVLRRSWLPILSRLNGRKKLLRGNHDIWKVKDYLPYFEEVASVKVNPEHKLIFSHYPLHTSTLMGGHSLAYKTCKINIHGHTHANNVRDGDQEDPRYINICVEHTDYKPVSWEQILKTVSERRQQLEEKYALHGLG